MDIIRKNDGLLPSFFGNLESNLFNDERLDRFRNVAVNIKEREDDFVIEMAIPGVKKEDVNIEIEENKLIVSAETSHEIDETKERYSRREFSYGSFTRSFTLPREVDVDKIAASSNDGVLNISIPKPQSKKKKVKKITLK